MLKKSPEIIQGYKYLLQKDGISCADPMGVVAIL